MDTTKVISGIALAGATMLGVDAAVIKDTVQPMDISVAEEVVSLRQVENTVEATMPWKDQPGLTIKRDLGEPTLAERVADKRKQEVVTEVVDDFDGGFKVDILLNEKPDTNKFCYTIDGHENYNFLYQPPLTPEEIANGVERPEEIVGSFAVYHKELKNHEAGKENYATGKMMHIPFPYVWEVDDESTKQRAEDFTFDQGELCVTVQQDFLDTATYPVRVDPTFGYMAIGATGSESGGDDFHGILLTVPAGYSSLTAIIGRWSKASAAQHKAVVTNSSLVILANGVSNAGSNTGSSAWETYTFGALPTLTASTDFVFGQVHGSGGNSQSRYDTDAGVTSYYDATNSYTTPTDPTDASSGTRRYSIYATYTATAGAGPELVDSIGAALGETGGTTGSIDTTGATLIVVGVAGDTGGTPAVSDSEGNTYTLINSQVHGFAEAAFYYVANPTVDAAHTFTVSGASVYASIAVAAFSGTAASPFDQENGANGFATTINTGSVTPTEDNELLVTFLAFNSAGLPTSMNMSFSVIESTEFGSGVNYGSSMGYLVQSTASAVNPGWFRTNTNGMATRIATFKAEAAAAPSGVVPQVDIFWFE